MPLRKSTWNPQPSGDSPLVATVRGASLQAILDIEANAGPRALLEAATRELTSLLGETGVCTLLGEGAPSSIISHGAKVAAEFPDIDVGSALAKASLAPGPIVVGDGSSIAVPLSHGDRCLGVVLVRSEHPRPATEEERATALLVARLTAALLMRTTPGQAIRSILAEPSESESAPREPQPTSGDGRRVLLVEDDAATAAALVEALEDEGYVVLRACDGREGVARALSSDPHVILFDINLPLLDGFSAADQVRAAGATRDTPIIFLSARRDLCQQVQARRLDNVDFISKPLSASELLTRINQAIMRARVRHDLEQRAVIDELTGLGNLRMFRERLRDEHERFSRYANPLSLAMIDVDKLKTINDQKGHLAGSDVLRAIADILRRQARTTDVAARYGGDEMVVLLPHTTLEDAVHFAERVRSAVARLIVHDCRPTISIGVASLTPHGDETDHQLLTRADSAAYSAKRAGGNRTCVSGTTCGGA